MYDASLNKAKRFPSYVTTLRSEKIVQRPKEKKKIVFAHLFYSFCKCNQIQSYEDIAMN